MFARCIARGDGFLHPDVLHALERATTAGKVGLFLFDRPDGQTILGFKRRQRVIRGVQCIAFGFG
ncbi:hypothetical protein [Sphingomonas sp. LR55]|uniref:hypothetical protein n=1 Tax=Sphingomonas sp. LR55 TaxID=3050231 RepID=UPI002FE0271F